MPVKRSPKVSLTVDEIKSINQYQQCMWFHPYTCGKDNCRSNLVAQEDGLLCPQCGYHQTFIHEFTRNGKWRENAESMQNWINKKPIDLSGSAAEKVTSTD